MEQVEEEGLETVVEVDRLQHKHHSYIQTSAAPSSTALLPSSAALPPSSAALPPSSTALPPSSPLAPHGASFLVLAEPIIFHPNVTMQCKSK